VKKIGGDLGLMSLPDLLQWAEMNKKTGTVSISYKGVERSFYLQAGNMVFVSSSKEGERLGEFLHSTGILEPRIIASALQVSKRHGMPFTAYLVEKGIVDQETLRQTLQSLVEKILSDALTWEGGTFEFSDDVPPLISKGPVVLNISFLVFNSVKIVDEIRRQAPAETLDIADALKQIARQIVAGYPDVPLVADVIIRLNNAPAGAPVPDVVRQDVIRIVSSYPVLTSRILKVVNSAFYGPPCSTTSLQEAVGFGGLKMVQGIATLHAIEGKHPENKEKLRELLIHSLYCAFIAVRIAPALRLDAEDAFVCGLLHDIGKVLILDYMSGKRVDEGVKQQILRQYHDGAGFILGSKWKFSETVKEAIRCHHNPSGAPAYKEMARLVCAADMIANTGELLGIRDACLDFDVEKISSIVDDLENMKNTAESII